MGCRGIDRDSSSNKDASLETRVTCYTKLWGKDWKGKKGCMGSGSMCIGCSNPKFPFTTYTTDDESNMVATSSSIYKFLSPAISST
jgi:Ni,Fe-hydrogenase I small subunit